MPLRPPPCSPSPLCSPRAPQARARASPRHHAPSATQLRQGKGLKWLASLRSLLVEAPLHADEQLRCLPLLLFVRASLALQPWSSSATSTALPYLGAVRLPGISAAMRHARLHACSSEPPGQAATLVDAVRCPKRVGAHCATEGLATGELRPAELLPCLCATGQWGLGAQRQ
jgi:hypothetical protein